MREARVGPRSVLAPHPHAKSHTPSPTTAPGETVSPSDPPNASIHDPARSRTEAAIACALTKNASSSGGLNGIG